MKTLILAGLIFAAGCKKQEAAPATDGPGVDATEVARAEDACNDYKVRVCARAERVPEVEEACRMADSRIEAVTLQAKTLNASGLSKTDRAVVLAELRKISAGCIQDAASLRQ